MQIIPTATLVNPGKSIKVRLTTAQKKQRKWIRKHKKYDRETSNNN